VADIGLVTSRVGQAVEVCRVLLEGRMLCARVAAQCNLSWLGFAAPSGQAYSCALKEITY
jgi:hypothetical protein